MHGALPCGSYLAGRGGPAGCHICPCSTCRPQPPGRRPRDSLTHIFVDCPAYAGARQWLADVWQAVSGRAPPLTAAVLVGDCAAAWPAYPLGDLQRLWSALRLAWLFATWVVHRGAAGPRCSSTVVAYAVGYLQQRMRAAFALCAVQRYVYDRLPARVAAVRLHQPPLAAFRRLWGAGGGVLAAVVHDPVTGQPRLVVRLSLAHPAPAPPPPPPPPPPPAAAAPS
jgi:hypothetical protein